MTNQFNLQIISCLIYLLALGSCNNSKPVPTDEYLRIGDGGGFTGLETIHTIYKNGQLEQLGKIVGKLKKSEVTQLFNNISILNLEKIEWNKPGNLYKFIEYRLKGKTHRLTWDSNATEVNNNLNLFYNHVNHIIQKSKK